jgi:hypothetical protein
MTTRSKQATHSSKAPRHARAARNGRTNHAPAADTHAVVDGSQRVPLPGAGGGGAAPPPTPPAKPFASCVAAGSQHNMHIALSMWVRRIF